MIFRNKNVDCYKREILSIFFYVWVILEMGKRLTAKVEVLTTMSTVAASVVC